MSHMRRRAQARRRNTGSKRGPQRLSEAAGDRKVSIKTQPLTPSKTRFLYVIFTISYIHGGTRGGRSDRRSGVVAAALWMMIS